MRIAHVTATFPPTYTGTGMVCYHNAVGLARLGHQVTVFTADHPHGKYAYPEEITVHRLRAALRLGNAPLLLGLLRMGHFDIVHLHYPFYFGAEVLFLKSLLGKLAYVVTYHQDVLFQGWMRLPERLHHHLLGRQILGRARTVLATSMDYARASRLNWQMLTRPGSVREMPNGVDIDRYHPGIGSSQLVARHGLDSRHKVVLFVGGLDRAHYFKGVQVLLDAMVRMNRPDTWLMLVGDGDLRSTYQERARRLGLQDRAIFCGPVPYQELPAYYALCDLLVLPSVTMGEAFGLVLLEAMACGKPVIASNLPGVRSVVSDGEDGLLARPGDAGDLAGKIEALLSDPQRSRQMGDRGRAKVEATYTWDKIVPKLGGVYEDVLRNG